MQPQPLARIGAHEAIKGAGRGPRSEGGPGLVRSGRRIKDGQDLKDVIAAVVASTGSDDQGGVRPGGKRGGRAIDPRRTSEEIAGHRVAARRGHLVNHHGDGASSTEDFAGARHGPARIGQRDPLTLTRRLPKGVERRDVQAFGHDKQLDLPCQRARRKVPVAGMGGGDHDPPPLRHRVGPSPPRIVADASVARGLGAARRQPEKFDGAHPK